MATNPSMVIKIAADLTALQAQLQSGQFAIETTTQKMVSLANSYSGQRTVQQAHDVMAAIEAVGGVTNLTAKEQAQANRVLDEAVAKYQAMGREAPQAMLAMQRATETTNPNVKVLGERVESTFGAIERFAGMLGIGLGIERVVDFGSHVLETASQIGDLSTRLGVSTEFTQRMSFAAGQTGTTMQAVGTAIEKMNATLSKGEDSTIKILRDAHLSFDEIRAMKPEDAFYAITDAIQKIPDPMLQAEMAVRIFGKGGQEILPAIKEGFRDIGAAAAVMSKSTVKSLKDVQDQWEAAKQQLTVWAAEAATQGGKQAFEFGNAIQFLKIRITEGKEAAADFNYGIRRLAGDLQNVGDVSLTAANNVKPLTQAQREAKEEAEKATKAQDDAIKVLKSYYGVAETVNQQTKEEVNGWLDLGASIQTVQAAYRLTEGQMKLITQAREADTKATEAQVAATKKQNTANEELMAAARKLMEDSGKLWREYFSLRDGLSQTSTDKQIADVQRWSLDTKQKFEASKEFAKLSAQDVADFYAALDADAKAKTEQIGLDMKAITDAMTNHTQAGLQQQADNLKKTYDFMLSKVGLVDDAIIESARKTWQTAQDAANNFSLGTTSALETVSTRVDTTAAKVNALASAFANAARAGQSVAPYTGGAYVIDVTGAAGFHTIDQPYGGGRASGGYVAPNTDYTVGERGPETLRMGASGGYVIPHGSGSAGGSVTINVNAGISSAADTGRAVVDTLTAYYRSIGMRFQVAS
jgi:hypothetical protein